VKEGRREGEREGGREESIDQGSFTDPILIIHSCQAREPRPLVACQAIQSLSLLLFNTKQDDMLHYLLSQNMINDLLFFDMDVDGEEVGREDREGGREGWEMTCNALFALPEFDQ